MLDIRLSRSYIGNVLQYLHNISTTSLYRNVKNTCYSEKMKEDVILPRPGPSQAQNDPPGALIFTPPRPPKWSPEGRQKPYFAWYKIFFDCPVEG